MRRVIFLKSSSLKSFIRGNNTFEILWKTADIEVLSPRKLFVHLKKKGGGGLAEAKI